MKRYSLSLLLIAVTLTTLPLSGQALAAAWSTCNGRNVVWGSGHFATVRNSCSIGDSGDRNSSYWNAIGQWQSVQGVINGTYVWPPDRCWITHGDGWNDVAVVNRGDIDGNNGLTLTFYDSCFWWWDTQHIVEADAMIASDMTFYNPDESQWTDRISGRDTFTHELGHAHGLLHSEYFGQMRTYQPRPYVGGWGDHISVLPDDAWGIRALYGGPGYRNLFASAQEISGPNVVTTNPAGTMYVCKNEPVNLRFTFGNTGSWGVDSFRIRVSMNNVPPLDGAWGGWDLGYWTGWVSPTGTYSGSYPVWVPDVPVGIYWLYFNVDDNWQIDELRHSDNITHNAMTLYVLDCWW